MIKIKMFLTFNPAILLAWRLCVLAVKELFTIAKNEFTSQLTSFQQSRLKSSFFEYLPVK